MVVQCCTEYDFNRINDEKNCVVTANLAPAEYNPVSQASAEAQIDAILA